MAAISKQADTKLSFAKVAASGGKENVALLSHKPGPGSPAQESRKQPSIDAVRNQKSRSRTMTSSTETGIKLEDGRVVAPEPQKTSQDAIAEATAGKVQFDSQLVVGMSHINIGAPSVLVNGTSTSLSRRLLDSEQSIDERTDSGSDFGTKPPSLDGKSITSGTTFALDEKESLRPDDSASVKAAEDDDAFSGRGSIVAGSRIGSEAAARAYRAQGYDISLNRSMGPTLEHSGHGIMTPQSGSSGQQLLVHGQKQLIGANDEPGAFNLFYKQTPDEKLLEALDSPKDRLFLLRLEQDVIEFVKDSKEPFIDLPPCNSFCRMLTHKLADYYHMTHQVDATAGSVRIFRTPFCRLPQSLTSISNPPTTGHTPPPAPTPAMKIMRRGGDTGGSVSKATSDAGSDGKDKTLSAKEKLSREEREAAYNAARERIFGPNTGEATPELTESNEMSRSSSVSIKDKPKKSRAPKQRRDDSEGFDVRSAYTPFYPQAQHPGWAPTAQFAPMASQYNMSMQINYQGQPQPPFGPPPQPMYPSMMPVGSMQPYGPMSQQYLAPQMPYGQAPQPYIQPQQPYSQPMSPAQYANRSAPMTTYGSPSQTPPQQMQQWPIQPANFQNFSVAQRSSLVQSPGGTIPYAYGQLPSTANPADPKSQHPIPGSFNRHAFNPKTQSFVPATGPMSPQQSIAHLPPTHLQYNNFQLPPTYNNGNIGYNMTRQGSNTSLPSSYHASPHMAPRTMLQQPMPSLAHGLPQAMTSGHQTGSNLPHFGNASTLPPKPPPTM